MRARSSSSPRRSPAGVREASAGIAQMLPLCSGPSWLRSENQGQPCWEQSEGAPDPLWMVCFPAEVTFVSEMRTSKAFRLQHGGNQAVAVHGRFTALCWPASPSTAAFLALCTPVMRLPVDNDAGSQDNLFQSTHVLDMTFTDVTER